MTVTVRTAVRDDARAIATVRVETWRAAYAGLIADAVLDALDIEREARRRSELWEEHHSDPRGCELIAEVDGETAGWAAVGPAEDDDLDGHGKVFAIYALPAFWSRGVGHALMLEAERFLRDAGFERAVLWHLDGNERAASFYERHGWMLDGAAMIDDRLVGGVAAHALHEVRRTRDLTVPPGIRMPR